MSWADAAKSALDAAAANGCKTFYVGYNREMAEQYIEDVAYWAQAYQLCANKIEKEEVLAPGKEVILVYRVRFASGNSVIALSSRPSNLRAKQGNVVIDEAAFHQDLGEVIKAAMAFLQWGGKVRLISTHNGVSNPFNEIIQQTLAGKFDYSLHKYDLDMALRDGLYERICLVNRREYTKEAESQWRSKLFNRYGIGADEELLCIPLDVKGGGKVFRKEWFKIIPALPYNLYCVRFWDMAATAAELNQDAYYTASVLMGMDSGNFYILDARAKQLSPADSDEWMLETAQEDGYQHQVRWEKEGGSGGPRVEQHLIDLFAGYDAEGISPQGDKVTRAKPIAGQAKRGNVYLVQGDWNERFLNAIYAFDGTKKPLTNDFTDALSGASAALTDGGVASIIGT